MAIVYAPNEQFNGVRANVVFTNGVGETADPSSIDWFRERGYEVKDELVEPSLDPTNEGNETQEPEQPKEPEQSEPETEKGKKKK